MKSDQLKGMLIAVISEIIFGSSFIFIKMVDESISVFTLLSWRNIIALCLMTILIKIKILKVDYRGKNIRPVLALSLFQPVLYYIFETIGVRLTTASETGMLLACCPAITMIFAIVLVKERVNRLQRAFMLLAVFGGILSAVLGGFEASYNLLGYFVLVLAMCCESMYAIISSVIKDLTSTEKTYAMTIAGTVVFTSIALIQHAMGGTVGEYITLPFNDTSFAVAVLFLSICCNIIGFLTGNYVLPIIGAAKRGACGGFGTVTAILGGVLILHESFPPGKIIATILIMVGAYGVLFSNLKNGSSKKG